MKRRFYFYLLLAVMLPISVFGFDYELDFYGMDVSNLKTMGCRCESQDQFHYFYGEYLTDVAEFSHFNLGIQTGVIRRNTSNWLSKGFLSTYTALNLDSYLNTMGTPRDWEGFVVYVGWPEFGD